MGLLEISLNVSGTSDVSFRNLASSGTVTCFLKEVVVSFVFKEQLEALTVITACVFYLDLPNIFTQIGVLFTCVLL